MSDDLFEDPRIDIVFQEMMKQFDELGLPEHEVVSALLAKLQKLDGGMSQGARAGRSGGYLQNIICAAFEQFGVRRVKDNPEYHYESNLWKRKEKLLVEQPRIQGIVPDFLYIDFWKELRVAIECKQQVGPGSADRKLSYAIDDLLKLPLSGFWIAISGNGFSKKVLHTVQNKIITANKKSGIRGRLVADNILFRSIEHLVEKGAII
jgi:PD-(D/E)XK nuclease superfamily domain